MKELVAGEKLVPDVCWLKSINSREGGRMIGGTGPMVLASSLVLSRGRGENGRRTSHFSHTEEDFQARQGQKE